jgi:ABC-2 type transport system permease protein
MNIIKRELRANLKPLIIWSSVLTLLILAVSTEFAAFRDNPEIMDAMDQFEVMFQAIGGSMANVATPEGFISLMSIYIYLPISIYGALLGSSIISKEERDKTAEYLFTLPINRNQVLLRKVIAAVFYQLVFIVYILSMITMVFYRFELDSVFYSFMINLAIGLTFISLIFLSLGMLLSSVLKQYKKSGSITLGVLIGTYMLNMLVGVVEDLDFLKYIIPFQYFEVSEMLAGNFELIFILLASGIIISCFTGVFVFYKKRDLYI